MTTHLCATGDRSRTLAAIVLLIAAALVLDPAVGHAATSRRAPLLAQGAGMGAKPSPAVRTMQRALHRRGYDLGPPGVDGRFGPLTDAAVRRFQRDSHLAVDGLVGPRTRAALDLPTPDDTRTREREPRDRRQRAERRPPRGGERSQRATDARRERDRASATATPHPGAATGTAARRHHPPLEVERTGRWQNAIVLGAVLAALVVVLWVTMMSWSHRVRDRSWPAITRRAGRRARGDESHAWRVAPAAPIDERPAPDRSERVVAEGADADAPPADGDRGRAVIGYAPAGNQGAGGGGNEPCRVIEEACERAGWTLVEIVRDRENGRPLERPGLSHALERIADGDAAALIIADLRLVSRSIVDLGTLLAWLQDAGAALIALDLRLDTSTPHGREVSRTLITLGAWEHERIARRTRLGLAEVRASGRPTGPPSVSDRPELLERIGAMRRAGMTLQAIADQLNAENVPTLRGGVEWRPSSVQAALGYRRPSARNPRDPLPRLDKRTAR